MRIIIDSNITEIIINAKKKINQRLGRLFHSDFYSKPSILVHWLNVEYLIIQ